MNEVIVCVMNERNEPLLPQIALVLPQIALGVLGFSILLISFLLSGPNIEKWVSFSLNVIGTLLSTCASAWFFGRAAEKRRFYSELDIVRSQLASAAANLGGSVEAGLSEDEEPEIALLRIGENVSLLQMLVQHLNKITGSDIGIDRETIIEAREALSDLGSKIYTIRSIRNDGQENDRSLDEIEKSITELSNTLNNSEKLKFYPPRVGRRTLSHREKMSSRDRFLARIRRQNAQFIGKALQTLVAKEIFEILSDKTEMGERCRRHDIYEECIRRFEACEPDVTRTDLITKTKFAGVLRMFIVSGALEFTTDNDEERPWVRFTKDNLTINDFLSYHDGLMYSFNTDGLLSEEELSEFLLIKTLL